LFFAKAILQTVRRRYQNLQISIRLSSASLAINCEGIAISHRARKLHPYGMLGATTPLGDTGAALSTAAARSLNPSVIIGDSENRLRLRYAGECLSRNTAES
jgi:hypothetical protein